MLPLFERAAAAVLALLLMYGLLVLWVDGRWALAVQQAGVLLLGAAWLLRLGVRCELPLCSPYMAALAVPILWGLMQLLFGWTVYRYATWESLLAWTMLLVVFWLTFELCQQRTILHGLRTTWLWFGFALSASSVVFYFTAPGKVFGIFSVGPGAVGPFLNRDHYATFVVMTLPLALWEALTDRRKTWSRGLMAGAMYASVIAGASRMGSLLVTLEVLLMVFVTAVPRWTKQVTARRAIAWTLLFTAMFTAVVGWEVLWERFSDPDPFAGRREMLQSSLAMVRERPLTGFGLGNWSLAYPAYATRDFGISLYANHAHNDWAEWAVEGGMPVLLAMLSLALLSFRHALEHPWALGITAAFVHCLVDFPLRRLPLAALMCALLATLAASEQFRVRNWRQRQEATDISGGPASAPDTIELNT